MLARILTSALVALSLTACHRLSANERRLIGTWEYTTVDAIGRLRFYADHKVALWFVDSAEEGIEPRDAFNGTWRVDGDQVALNIDYKSAFKDSPLKPPESEGKMPLSQFDRAAQKTHDRPYFVLIHD